MKTLTKIFYKIFKRYQTLELKFCKYSEADKLIRQNEGKAEEQQWVLAKQEDSNHTLGFVFIERRRRITE